MGRKRASEGDVAQLLGTTPLGTRLESVARNEVLGFRASILVGTLDDLRAVTARGVPMITAVHTSQLPTHPLPPWERHAVVVAGVAGAAVAVHDPARSAGPDLIPAERFSAAWGARGYRMAFLERR